VHKAIMALA